MTDEYSKLKPEFKKSWLEALRSGNFNQGNGFLHSKDDFCCLGVLCEVNRVPSKIKDDSEYFFPEYSRIYTYAFPYSEMEHSPDFYWLRELFENSEEITYLDLGRITDKLIDMNDGGGKNFNEIADWIEENL